MNFTTLALGIVVILLAIDNVRLRMADDSEKLIADQQAGDRIEGSAYGTETNPLLEPVDLVAEEAADENGESESSD